MYIKTFITSLLLLFLCSCEQLKDAQPLTKEDNGSSQLPDEEATPDDDSSVSLLPVNDKKEPAKIMAPKPVAVVKEDTPTLEPEDVSTPIQPEFSEELLIESKTTFKKISDFVIDSKPQPKNDELLSLFEECMNDDLNTPKLIGEIFTQMNNATNLENGMLDDIKATVKYIFEILGFTFKKNVTKKVSIEDMEKFFNQYEIIFDSVEQAMSEFLKIRSKNGNGSNKNNQKQRNKRNNGRKRY